MLRKRWTRPILWAKLTEDDFFTPSSLIRGGDSAGMLEKLYCGNLSHHLWMCLGCLHDNLGDQHESLRCFEISHQFAPRGSWEALYNKAIALEKLGSYGEAAAILGDLIKEHPEKPKFFAERGYCAMNQGYPHEALQYYQIAMRLWEQAPSVYEGVCIYSGLCTAYAEMGLKKEAMEIALEGLKRFPDEDAILYHNLGVTFFGMGWKQEAREVLKKGVEKFPEDEELKNLFQRLHGGRSKEFKV